MIDAYLLPDRSEPEKMVVFLQAERHQHVVVL